MVSGAFMFVQLAKVILQSDCRWSVFHVGLKCPYGHTHARIEIRLICVGVTLIISWVGGGGGGVMPMR